MTAQSEIICSGAHRVGTPRNVQVQSKSYIRSPKFLTEGCNLFLDLDDDSIEFLGLLRIDVPLSRFKDDIIVGNVDIPRDQSKRGPPPEGIGCLNFYPSDFSSETGSKLTKTRPFSCGKSTTS